MSERSEYQSKYYQNNKERLRSLREKRKAETVSDYLGVQ